jgi:hypothetical protein
MDDIDKEKELALFAYLLAQGQLTPEQEKLLRQQQQVDALRQQSMEMPQTQMYGRVAVAPSWAQALGSVAKGISAGYQQQGLDKQYKGMSDQRAEMLRGLMSSMGGDGNTAGANDETAQRQRNAAQYGVPLTDEEIRRRQMGMESL